jgi:hypothetical protein
VLLADLHLAAGSASSGGAVQHGVQFCGVNLEPRLAVLFARGRDIFGLGRLDGLVDEVRE